MSLSMFWFVNHHNAIFDDKFTTIGTTGGFSTMTCQKLRSRTEMKHYVKDIFLVAFGDTIFVSGIINQDESYELFKQIKEKKIQPDKDCVYCIFLNREFPSHTDNIRLKNEYVTEKVSDPNVKMVH